MSKEEQVATLSFKEAVKLEKELRKTLRKGGALAEDELVLLVLGIRDRPIHGKVVIHKEIFLFFQELKDKIHVTDPQFVPYKYGPYSFRIAALLELLEEYGYVKVLNKKYKRLAKYVLTEKGRKAAEKVIDKIRSLLGEEYLNKLMKLRQGLDELGHDGILRYVYQYYKEYTEKSELKEKYIHIDWGASEA